MKIKDHTDMVRHLTDPFNIPEARRMIQENPALTQEQFKVGGLVEPGVMHYAKKHQSDYHLKVFEEAQKQKITKKEAAILRKNAPEGIKLVEDSRRAGIYNYKFTIAKEGDEFRAALRANPENLKKLVKLRETKMEELWPDRLTHEEFKNLRLSKENIKLSNQAFANKINKEGYTTFRGEEFKHGNVQRLQDDLKITDEVGSHTSRTLKEVKDIVRPAGGGEDLIKSFNAGKISESDLRWRATELVRAKKVEATKGKFPIGTSTKEGRLWQNFYRAAQQGDRIKIVGEFADGKLPIDKSGRVNWHLKDKDGVQAWKRVEFVDTKAPDRPAKFKWDTKWGTSGNLKNQVDDAFGKGHFARSTKAYDLQRVYANENFAGKKLGTHLNEALLLRDYKKKHGRLPNKEEKAKYFKRKKPGYSFTEVHHPEGVGANPYNTEVAFRDANRNLLRLEQKYNTAVKKVGADVKKLTSKFVDDIKAQPGGIRYQVGEKMVGTKATRESIIKTGAEEMWRSKIQHGKAVTLAKALELKGIKICTGSAEGGRIGFGKGTKCGTALAADNPNLYMKLAKESTQAQDLFKSGQIGKYLKGARNWTRANMGPAGLIGGELLIMGLGTLYEVSQGKGWKEGLDTWTGLGGHAGMAEDKLKEIGKKQGWSEQQVYDAMKFQKLLALSQEGEEKEWELENLLEQQDIGGTARVKYNPKHPGAYKPTQDQYQDPKYLRNLKEEVAGIWDEGGDLYETLMNPQTSAALLQELQDRKKYEELEKKKKIWEWTKKRPGIGQQLEASEPSELGPFERSPGHPGYTGAFTKWQPYAEGGIASLKKK